MSVIFVSDHPAPVMCCGLTGFCNNVVGQEKHTFHQNRKFHWEKYVLFLKKRLKGGV